jgi:integrase
VSLLIDQGVGVKAVAAHTGHARAAMLLDVYGHRMPGSHAEVKAALSRAFNGKSNLISLRAA